MQDRELYLTERPTLAILKNPPDATMDLGNFEPTMREPVRLPTPSTSRRRKLWDLAAHCHCPIIGLCLSMNTLRKLAARVLDGDLPKDDYELHVNAVNEARRRGPLAEVLQKELDQRYAMPIRKLNSIKTAEALHEAWRGFIERGEMPAGLWACMTHPRCDPGMLEKIYREVHMLQHQASAASRDKEGRYQMLSEEHARCLQDLEKSRQRYQQLQAEKTGEIDALQAEVLRLRNDNAAKENSIKQLQEELASLRQQAEDLDSRIELAEQVRWLSERNQELMQRLVDMRHKINAPTLDARATPDSGANTNAGTSGVNETRTPAEAQSSDPLTARADHGCAETETAGCASEGSGKPCPADNLDSRAVLCVGGRHHAIHIYRRIVEKRGGRFIHHDGGREDSVHRLDTNLAAADLVICQAGCISHSAYWLVKDHCKRTGKRCVYVDKPSASAFERGLVQGVQDNALFESSAEETEA
ncbi:MAG: DUF2325 domain-containing protein [Lautropia sp.]|nr:DUF2325 domain-containing protein [Lautropia sp.]